MEKEKNKENKEQCQNYGCFYQKTEKVNIFFIAVPVSVSVSDFYFSIVSIPGHQRHSAEAEALSLPALVSSRLCG